MRYLRIRRKYRTNYTGTLFHDPRSSLDVGEHVRSAEKSANSRDAGVGRDTDESRENPYLGYISRCRITCASIYDTTIVFWLGSAYSGALPDGQRFPTSRGSGQGLMVGLLNDCINSRRFVSHSRFPDLSMGTSCSGRSDTSG